MRELGPLSTALGHYALGRGHVALERWDEALVELEKARQAGYRGEGLSYALGLTHGTLYQRAIGQLAQSDDKQADDNARAAIIAAHREPALRNFHDARRTRSAFSVGRDDFVRALIALYEERFDVALALARKAAIASPGLYEARTLEGDINASLAADRAWKGDDAGELEGLERAGQAYAAALEVARSSAAALLGDCRRLLRTAHNRNRLSLSPELSVGRAVAACARAAEVRRDDALPLALQAEAWTALGEYQAEHALDPKAALDAALGLGGRALALDPNHVPTLHVLSDANEILGGYLFRKGDDARAAIDRAIQFARRTIALDPRRFSAYASLGYALRVRALDEVRHGRDPRASYREMIAAAEEQRRSFRGSTRALRLMQSGYANLGIWQRDHGVDPLDALAHGIAACKEEIRGTPNAAGGHINLCYDEWALANHQIRVGQDPRPALEEGMAACRRAIELTPNDWIPHLDLAVSRSALARFQLERGHDPMSLVAEARIDLERSLAIDSNMVTLRYVAEVEQTAGRWLALQNGDADARFAVAEAALRKVISADANDADGLRRLADLLRYRAEWRFATKHPAEAVIREGLEFANRARSLEPDLGEGNAIIGALHLLESRAESDVEERIRSAAAAQTALRLALTQNAFLKGQYGPLLQEASLRSRP
jgi:eukaryotic-like serine/threonine-protein kinase